MLSTMFLNIDGNLTNFYRLSTELNCFKHKFTAIGLAETNNQSQASSMYKIPHYNELYQEPRKGKQTGTGVALYIHD